MFNTYLYENFRQRIVLEELDDGEGLGGADDAHHWQDAERELRAEGEPDSREVAHFAREGQNLTHGRYEILN